MRDQFGAVRHTGGVGGVARVRAEGGLAEGSAEAAEQVVVAAGDGDVTGGGGEGLVGHDAGVGVALALRVAAGGEIAERLVRHGGHLHVEQGDVHPLPFAGAVAVVQGGQDAVAGVHAGHDVRNGHAGAHRLAVGHAGEAHQAADTLDDEIVARAFGVGAVLAIAGDGAVDQAGVFGAEVLVAEAVFGEAADLEVFHQDVAFGGQGADQGGAFGAGHVDGDGLFAAVGGHEVAGHARTRRDGALAVGRRPASRVIALARPFHFNDRGA